MRLLILLAVAALAVSMFGAPQPWATLVIAAFLLVGPGLAVLPLLPGTDRLTRAAVVVGASVALTAVLSEALAIAGAFSTTALILILAALSALGCALASRRAR